MTRRWSKTEVTYLKRYSKSKTQQELATHFGTDLATVNSKMEELGLGGSKFTAGADPQLATFEKALAALGKEKWAQAAKGFETVASQSEQTELSARARQYLRYCQRELEKLSETADDPYLMAVIERNRGNLDAALKLCTASPARKSDESFAYLAAALLALKGDESAASEQLVKAIELNPKHRIHALYDSDFEDLRAADEYAHIFAGE